MGETKNYELILRIGLFFNFFVHGVFALMLKQSWIHYFTSVGISDNIAIIFLPLIGILHKLTVFLLVQ